jgi:ribosomal protein S18 acetylase RimI-like enzyme
MTEPVFTSPSSPEDWEQYFDLRWRILRAPWDQPRGSEKDDREAESTHLMAIDRYRQTLAVGRLHLNSPSEAQVRFMAVAETARGLGLGSALLQELEALARKAGADRVVLNAREDAQRFYEKNGYVVTGPAPTIFSAVNHVRMAKQLRS